MSKDEAYVIVTKDIGNALLVKEKTKQVLRDKIRELESVRAEALTVRVVLPGMLFSFLAIGVATIALFFEPVTPRGDLIYLILGLFFISLVLYLPVDLFLIRRPMKKIDRQIKELYDQLLGRDREQQ